MVLKLAVARSNVRSPQALLNLDRSENIFAPIEHWIFLHSTKPGPIGIHPETEVVSIHRQRCFRIGHLNHDRCDWVSAWKPIESPRFNWNAAGNPRDEWRCAEHPAHRHR